MEILTRNSKLSAPDITQFGYCNMFISKIFKKLMESIQKEKQTMEIKVGDKFKCIKSHCGFWLYSRIYIVKLIDKKGIIYIETEFEDTLKSSPLLEDFDYWQKVEEENIDRNIAKLKSVLLKNENPNHPSNLDFRFYEEYGEKVDLSKDDYQKPIPEPKFKLGEKVRILSDNPFSIKKNYKSAVGKTASIHSYRFKPDSATIFYFVDNLSLECGKSAEYREEQLELIDNLSIKPKYFGIKKALKLAKKGYKVTRNSRDSIIQSEPIGNIPIEAIVAKDWYILKQ